MRVNASSTDCPCVAQRHVRVWDLPIRLGHWLLVALVGTLWWSAENHIWALHTSAGEAVLVWVVFRIFWGFSGSPTARFAHFLKSPRAIAAYARTLHSRRSAVVVGHNPLGGWSILAMLAVLFVLTCSGLCAQNIDGFGSGPLADFVSYRVADGAASLHGLFFQILVLLVGLHLAAIAFYAIYKRQDLVGAMFSGYTKVPSPGSNDPVGPQLPPKA